MAPPWNPILYMPYPSKMVRFVPEADIVSLTGAKSRLIEYLK